MGETRPVPLVGSTLASPNTSDLELPKLPGRGNRPPDLEATHDASCEARRDPQIHEKNGVPASYIRGHVVGVDWHSMDADAPANLRALYQEYVNKAHRLRYRSDDVGELAEDFCSRIDGMISAGALPDWADPSRRDAMVAGVKGILHDAVEKAFLAWFDSMAPHMDEDGLNWVDEPMDRLAQYTMRVDYTGD